MAKVYESASELVGKTPLLKLNKYQESEGVKDASILAKLEYLNPAGSVKDRVALQMIEDLEESRQIKPGATLIEPTSGNTGIEIREMNSGCICCSLVGDFGTSLKEVI